MQKNLKTTLLALATTAAVAVPLAGYAFAQTTPATQTQAQTNTAQNEGPEGTEANDAAEVKIQGSIALPAEAQGTELTDAQEQAQYAKLAKITPEQAKQAALAVAPGTVSSIELEDEDGFLVYEVVIGNKEVIVDAGNGKVLAQEVEEPDNEAGETGETNDD